MKKFLIVFVFGFFVLLQSVHAADLTLSAKSSTANSVTVTLRNNGKEGINPTTGMYYSVFSGSLFAVNSTTNAADNSATTGQPIPGGQSRDITITMLKPSTAYSVKAQEGGFYNASASATFASVTIATKTGTQQPCTPPQVVVNGVCVTPLPPNGGGGDPVGTSGGDPVGTPGTTYIPPKNPNNNQASGFNLQVRLNNPLKVDNIKDAVKFFVNALVKIAIPFIVVFFIWAGLKFITAQGKPDKLKEARQMFWYTIIGTLLILGAWTITNAIIGTVNSIAN